ncbi:glycosyltransferase family 4 protein [Corynebacterium pilbarense]|uniref:Glycosyltransferase family 4 protein n=1 Tax=Corynebacterium pilbarense TaxID=1288393 RepID=A0A9Q4NRU8_9CORY|nr:glycosyltransferase family 4 protein [Corynebacterium pilbarense]MCZ2220660.1 glycosyltransferase family 4 protein [Corynebacterium pilbarense]
MAADFLSGPKPFLQKVSVKIGRKLQESGFRLPASVESIARAGVPDTTSWQDLDDPIFPSVNRQPSGEARVLYFVNSAQPYTVSGYTVRTQKLLHELRRQNVAVYPATRVGYPATIGVVPTENAVSVDGIDYFLLLPSRMSLQRGKNRRAAINLLVEIARRLDITLLHTTTDFRNASLISEVARILGIPWVYEVRGERDKTLELENSGQRRRDFLAEFRRRETLAMQAASAVLVLSDVSRRRVEERGVSKDNIYVVPNGFDRDEAIEAPTRDFAREKIGIPSSTKLIGTFTSVVDYEGLDSLILALEFLDVDTKALIVGSGSELSALQHLADERGLTDRVLFAGKQDPQTIPVWCAALDVFVLPRKDYEVCRAVTPLKPMLAMGMNIPVVASDLPAVREATGELASYVPPDDPEALSEAIRKALVDPDHFYGHQLEGFLDTRTWQSSAERLLQAYEETLSPDA